MTRPTHSLKGYLRSLKTSDYKRLLVEGSTDKRFFDELFNSLLNSQHEIKVDVVDRITDIGKGLGNRQKVESVCKQVENNKEYSEQLVGFVDRDFDGFQIDKTIYDQVRCHNVQGCLVWSRGHSVENYFFDIDILRDPLKVHTTIENYKEVLELFQSVFDTALRIAGALSLAAREWNQIDRVKGTIRYNILQITNNKLHLSNKDWEKILAENFKKQEGKDIKQLIEYFEKWHDRVNKSDIEDIRWICHGHIGFSLLWETYAQCILIVSEENEKTKINDFRSNKEKVRFNACTNSLCIEINKKEKSYPVEVFQILGLK